MKKTSKCFDCHKCVDFVAALSTGLCEGCKNVFCFQHKFKHSCEQLLQIQEKKKQDLAQQMLLSKTKKTFF